MGRKELDKAGGIMTGSASGMICGADRDRHQGERIRQGRRKMEGHKRTSGKTAQKRNPGGSASEPISRKIQMDRLRFSPSCGRPDAFPLAKKKIFFNRHCHQEQCCVSTDGKQIMPQPLSGRKESEMENNKMMNEEQTRINEEIPSELLDMITGGEDKKAGYTCKFCGRTFMTITSIAAHVSSTHRN